MSTGTYEPRDPAQRVLYQVVRDHFETFRAQAAALREGESLPRFVEREFREFLSCGCLAAGFARFRCDGCRHDRLVPFSCKERGFCPSCGGRRMVERAAHLVDHVLPDVDSAMGLEPAVSTPISARLGSRSLSGSDRRGLPTERLQARPSLAPPLPVDDAACGWVRPTRPSDRAGGVSFSV